MATCNESIAAMGSYEDLNEVFPNTVTPFSVTSTSNILLRLPSPQVQTVKFNINTSTLPAGVTITAYSWNGSTAVPIGSVNITTPNAVAYIDFQIGNYILCIRPSTPLAQIGSFVAEFIGYEQEARFVPSVYVGEAFDMILSGPPAPPRECNEALFFDIIDGELPPGLNMNFMGTISGFLPNLDCIQDRWSPAVNWYYDENDGTSWPWGREWRFQVKVWVDGQPDFNTDEEWFCVRIYNNWTYDKERFLAQQPFEHVTQVRVVDPPKTLEPICQPCKKFEEEAMFIPQPLDKTKECLPCQDNQETKIELIPIPLDLCQVPVDDLLAWYSVNQNIDSNNPHIEKFKNDLLNSPAFSILRARAGYIEPEEFTEQQKQQQFVVMQNYQNFLQLSTVTLLAGELEEYKSIVREWQVLENQVLPMSGIGYMGETMEIKFKDD